MRAVAMDPGSHTGTYKLVGGTAALDFANLVSYRSGDRHHDWLKPASNLVVWQEAAGIDAPINADVADVRRFREVVAQTFLAVADNRVPTPAHLDEIATVVDRSRARSTLRFQDGAITAGWVDPAPTLLTAVALDAADLLTSSQGLERVGACRECRWLFLDGSRNRSRTWCDPTDCGNRARQRRHSRRHR